jgi:hypothetical protein
MADRENPIGDCAGFLVIVAALLSLSAILTLRETSREDLR